MSYAKNAQKYHDEMLYLKAEIDTYLAKHRRDDPKVVRNALIPLKRKLVTVEKKLSDDYNAMYRREGINTFEKLTSLQRTMQKDITSLQDDLIGMRGDYIQWHAKEMERKYPEPLDYKQNVEKVKDETNYKYMLFKNIREILMWQNKKISYCKCMDQYEVSDARRLQEKIREKYSENFDDLFNHTLTEGKRIGIKEERKLLEVRRDLIQQGQDDYNKDGTSLIIEKPSTLKAICDKANRITGYKKNLNKEIETYTYIIERDEEMLRLEREYHESGKYDEDIRQRQQEEENRYNPDWVIPDEEYKDEAGNIRRPEDEEK
jgi:hypothetical protein